MTLARVQRKPTTLFDSQARVDELYEFPKPKVLPMKATVLAFRGPLGSGKTAVCKYLEQTYTNIAKVSFADALKCEVFDALYKLDELAAFIRAVEGTESAEAVLCAVLKHDPSEQDLYLDATPEQKIGWVNKRKADLRPLLQWWGTEYRRGQDENYWVSQFIQRAKTLMEKGMVVVCDDCRFPNERAALAELGGFEVYIQTSEDKRIGLLEARDGKVNKGLLEHPSEAYNDPTDPGITALVYNDKGLDELMSTIERVLGELRVLQNPVIKAA